ncbi:MAG: hypothetical protein CM1200mP34_3640 [Verrucomicrobiales bacterium]|nr:MAG: hypothetical protein CM1200mP34_3640 [Verrucomicrobiales bacterium]
MQSALKPEVFPNCTATLPIKIRSGTKSRQTWPRLRVGRGETYIQEPPFFDGFGMEAGSISEISAHDRWECSAIRDDRPHFAGRRDQAGLAGGPLPRREGVEQADFNSYGSRRGNDRVMTRGTFANVRIKNLMVPGTEGGVTSHQPDGEAMDIYDAAVKYRDEGTPLVVVGGKEYGTGSSRDWAAKGTRLLGVRAVICESFERIHRSNLIGMGVLPLQFHDGIGVSSLRLNGSETHDVLGLDDELKAQQELTVRITRADGASEVVPVRCRIDTDIEIEYYRHGGILSYVLRQLVAKG